MIRTKILALVVGTLGIGIISQLSNLTFLIFAILPIGAMGYSRYIAEYSTSSLNKRINYLIKTLIFQNIPLLILIFLIIALFAPSISKLIFSNESYSFYIMLFAVSIPFGFINSLIDLYLKSMKALEYKNNINNSLKTKQAVKTGT